MFKGTPRKRTLVVLICFALLLVFIGSLGASLIQSASGKVKVRSINFLTQDGINMHALLYVPDTATDVNPAPAIVASHGYNNTAEVQGINSVELSRRGYVVMSIDVYWHGLSGGTSINVNNNSIIPDGGGYAALQYIATLPFVDSDRIGMVGHSMGCAVIQLAAMRAIAARENSPEVVVPNSLLLTSNAFSVNAEGKLPYADTPINVGLIFGQYDEWAENMWNTVKKGSEINQTPKAAAGMGFEGAAYETYYRFGDSIPVSREGAVDVARDKALRIIYSPAIDHPQVHASTLAANGVIDFFDITLKEGKETIPASNQVWMWKEAFTFVAMIGFLLFIVPFTLILLEIPYFKAIVRPEPKAPTVIDGKVNKIRYWLIYILCLLPAPLLFYWAVGYPIDIKTMGRAVPTVLPANNFLPLPAVNGLVVINVIVGLFLLIVFALTYKLVMTKNGVTAKDLGYRLPVGMIVRAFLLSAISFLSAYMLLVLAKYFFLVDFRLFVFSFKTLPANKWPIYLSYLIFFGFFFMVSSLTLNSFTRMRDRREWLNIVLMVLASCGGYVVLFLLDYGSLILTGIKMFEYVPFFAGNLTTALAGLFVWNMIFILPIAAIMARILFRATGSIWLGGFLNAMVVTLFAVSNTVIAAGVLL